VSGTERWWLTSICNSDSSACREQSGTSAAFQQSGSSSNFGSDVANAAANGAIGAARDYDWTYSCTWPGGDGGDVNQWQKGADPNRDRIPVERLGPPTTPGAIPEPILFYDDVMLFEDELGDNGSSMLSVKVRVMPSGFLVLQRFFLRVDNVVFRIFDTRMYVGFDDEAATAGSGAEMNSAAEAMSSLTLGTGRKSMRVIRECSGFQAKYADVKARLPPYKPNDLSPLTEPGWVTQQLGKMQEEKQRGLSRLADCDIIRPAVLPSDTVIGQESNRILGEVGKEATDEEKWKGEGEWVDVLILHGKPDL
jgi:type 2A phosphatase activator TIP41